MPLRRRCAVFEAAGARGGVAAQLPRDRRRCPGQLPGDRAHAMSLAVPERDLLSVGECQIAPRPRRCRRPKVRRCHAACLPKPPCPNRRRDASVDRRVLARASRRDRHPEPALLLMPPYEGRPGECSLARPARSERRHPVVIATPSGEVLRRPLEFTSAARSIDDVSVGFLCCPRPAAPRAPRVSRAPDLPTPCT